MTQLPAWYHTLRQDPLCKEYGFSFDTPEKIQEQKSSEIFEGKILIGASDDVGGYKAIQLWLDTSMPESLWFSFDESEFSKDFIFSVVPHIESLQKISADYVFPSKLIPSGENVIASVARIRTAQPIRLNTEGTTEQGYFIGHGDWYDMVELENNLVFNPYLSLYVVCQATAENVDGNFTQHYTAYSSSLYSLIRYELYGSTFFYVFVEYEPAKDTRYVKQLKQTVLKGHPLESVPDDMPLDVLGALYNPTLKYFPTQDQLIQEAQEGDFNSLLFLSAMTFVSQNFEEVFGRFAAHPDIRFRSLVAEEAWYRNKPVLMEEAIANGIEEAKLADIRTRQQNEANAGLLSEEQKAAYVAQLQTDDREDWNKEWIRVTNLQFQLIEKYGFEGYKLAEGLGEGYAALGEFPAESPWASLNGLSIPDAIAAVFKPIAAEIPKLIKALQNRCLYIYTGKNESGEWQLYYVVQKILHDKRYYYSILVGGSPLPDALPAPSLQAYGWELPEDLVALYAIHNGFGEADRGILPNEELMVMAGFMPASQEGEEYDLDYSFEDLLVVSGDGAGNYTCIHRLQEDEFELVDWDHETWELSEMGDLFDFMNGNLGEIDEDSYGEDDYDEDDYEDDYDDEEGDNYEDEPIQTGIEFIDAVLSNVGQSEEKIIQTLDKLLSEGVSIEQKDEKGKTALVWAAEHGLYKTTAYLIKRGADVNAKDIDRGVPLFWAAYRGRTEAVRQLLNHGAEINVQDDNGDTALIFAAMYGQHETVQELLARGADKSLKNVKGKSPLDWARSNRHPKVEKLLLDNPKDGVLSDVDYDNPDDEDKLDKYILKPFEEPYIEFKDFNFKLAVIQVLMFEEELLLPIFDVYEFAELYEHREIDVDEEGYGIIPEVKQYFEELKISQKFAPLITELFQDVVNDVYMELCPFWDGEDDLFNIQSAEDAVHFPNLKTVTLFYEDEPLVLEQFSRMGIEAEYL
jgi:ankyrin repeat protein